MKKYMNIYVHKINKSKSRTLISLQRISHDKFKKNSMVRHSSNIKVITLISV
jgi:hypothetical protein